MLCYCNVVPRRFKQKMPKTVGNQTGKTGEDTRWETQKNGSQTVAAQKTNSFKWARKTLSDLVM